MEVTDQLHAPVHFTPVKEASDTR